MEVLVCAPVFSLALLKMAQHGISGDFTLMWEWGRAKSFDVVVSSTQATNALSMAWGGHWFTIII